MEAFAGGVVMLSIAPGSLSSALVLTQSALMLLPPPQLSVPSPRATEMLASLTSSKSSRKPASPSHPFLPRLCTHGLYSSCWYTLLQPAASLLKPAGQKQGRLLCSLNSSLGAAVVAQ